MVVRGGLVIRRMRKEAGYTQTELGLLYGVTPNTISRWEKGRFEPSFFNVYGLGKCMKFDTVDIYRMVNDIEHDRQEKAA